MNTTFQPPFVDESRILLVDGLVSIYDQLIKSSQPRWVSLEAPSGWGKTRVAQEFYTRIAIRQEKQYWPNTILETLNVGRNHVAARRKRIYPDFPKIDREYGALPDFMWWGIACAERGVVASEVLLEDLEQLDIHKLYLEAAWTAHASFKEKYFSSLDSAKQGCFNSIEEGGVTYLTKLIEEMGSNTVFGLGLTVKLFRWGLGNIFKTIENEKKLEYSGTFTQNEKRDDLLEDTLAVTIKLSQHIPIVLFVEDFHLASPLIIKLIDCLIRSGSKILIITTAWPEQLNQHIAIQPLLKDPFLDNCIYRVQNGEKTPDVFPVNASLDELTQSAMQKIVLSYYPEVEPDTLDKLVRRYNNPLPLELVCSLPQYQRQFPQLTLSPNEINRLPNSAKGIYQEIWNTLSDDIRQALTLATLGIPNWHFEWQKEMIQNAIKKFEIVKDKEVVANTFETNHLPKSWVRIIEDWSQRLSEPDQLQLIQENTYDLYSDNEVKQFLTLLAEETGKKKLDHADPAASHRAWLMVSLHTKELIDDDTVFRAFFFLQKNLQKFPRELPTRIWIGKNVSKLNVNKCSTEMLLSRNYYTIDLGEFGQLAEAIEQSRILLIDLQRTLGVDHPQTLATRGNIAVWLDQLGKKEAIEQFRDLLIQQQRVLGADHPDTLMTRNNIAVWLGKFEQKIEAIEQFRDLMVDLKNTLGTDHPITLKIRNNFAFWLEQFEQVTEAIEQYRTLLADQHRLLGADHPDTLASRNNFAFLLAKRGQITEAIEQFKVLLIDQQRVLGDDHPDTLITRSNIAYWLAQFGQVIESIELLIESIELFNALLADQQRVLGAYHPYTLNTRNNIAFFLGESGKITEAIEQFKVLLIDQQHVLGADHPCTLNTSSQIAFWLGKYGQPIEMIVQYKALLIDQLRILGADHSQTLITRNQIALGLSQIGKVVEAIELSKTLLTDLQRILGVDHPDTLITRYNIATWLNQTGNKVEAIKLYKTLLIDQQRALGDNNPNTKLTELTLIHLLTM